MKKKLCIFTLILCIGIGFVFAQSEGDYRTRDNVSGNWNGTSVWQKYTDGQWTDVSTYPSSSDGVITIRHGATITTTAPVTADQLLVEGNLNVERGIVTINDGAGVDMAVSNTGVVEVSGDIINNGQMTVNGEISDMTGSNSVQGSGSFSLENGGTLKTRNFDGISYQNSGFIRCTGTKSFSTGGNYVFWSANNLQYSDGLPSTVNTLTAELSNGGTEFKLVLTGHVFITNRLIVLAGEINPSNYNITYASGATLEYGGLYQPQTSSNGGFPTTNGPTNLVINNSHGVSLHDARTISGDLTLTSGVLNLAGHSLTVDGSTFIAGGSFNRTSGTLNTDGYVDPTSYISIAEANNATYLVNPSASSTVESGHAGVVKRTWLVDVDSMGARNITFNWSDAEDGNYAWSSGEYPKFLWGGSVMNHVSFDAGLPRELVVQAAASAVPGSFLAENDSDESTLPLTLSTFTATATNNGEVLIRWATESESALNGFRVVRGISSDVNLAETVSVLIPANNVSGQSTYSFRDQSISDSGLYYYWLQVIELSGKEEYFGHIVVYVDLEAPNEPPFIAQSTGIKSIYPNPFNPSTTITYDIVEAGTVSLDIFNMRGQKVKTLVSGFKPADRYLIIWDSKDDHGKQLPSGAYFIRLQTPEHHGLSKLTLLK